MPPALTYPGVYIQEIPSGVRTIVGVATSITAFLGRAANGPDNEPTTIFSFADFERSFGGLDAKYPMSYAVRDFFLNGGSQALIVRLFKPLGESGFAKVAVGGLTLRAAYKGSWGSKLKVTVEMVDPASAPDVRAKLGLADSDAVFNIIATTGPTGTTERIQSLSIKPSSRRVDKVLEDESVLLRWDGDWQNSPPQSVTEGANDVGAAQDQLDAANKALADANNSALPDQTTIDAARTERDAAQAKLNAAKAKKPPVAEDVKAAQDELNEKQKVFDLRRQGLDPKAIQDATKAREDAQTELNALSGTPPTDPKVDAAKKKLAAAQKALDDANKGRDPGKVAAAVTSQETDATALKDALAATGAADSDPLTVATDFTGDANLKTGLYALNKSDLFNLLCIPPDTRDGDTPPKVYQDALIYCVKRRAMLIVDSPAKWSKVKETAAAKAKAGLSDLGLSGTNARNAALYFPRLIELDPNRDDKPDVFVPCGAVAGVMASTDVARGVWKAPAGLDAGINGIAGLQVNLSDDENGVLNPLGINCLRFFPISGRVVWGARTLRGADQLADEYKYVPVRRLALFIEESLYRGTQWVVFEPNDEPLWAQIRLNVGAFMHNLFRQGAFQGTTPRDAYFVKCDKETTTQTDINLGVVNIHVGFAPLKPAEFVVIKLQQMAGQIET